MARIGQALRSFEVRAGVLTGLVGATAFLVLHALLIEPIWLEGAPRALAVVLVAGGTVGWGYARLREALPLGGVARGAYFGFLLSLTYWPSVFAVTTRIDGQPPLATALVLAPLLFVALLSQWFGATGQAGAFTRRGTRRGLAVIGLGVLLNGYPAAFLLFLPELVTDHEPDPFTMPLVLLAILAACGFLLEALLSTRDPR